MYELKKTGKLFTSKFVGTGPTSCEKITYRAVVSQRLRNTALGDCSVHRLREDWLESVLSYPVYLKRVTIPDAVLTQFDLLKMSIIVLEICRGMY